MKKTINYSIFDSENNIFVDELWKPDSYLSIEYEEKSNYINISGNKNGLVSFAQILLSFAENDLPSYYHMHLDSEILSKNKAGDLQGNSNNVVIYKNNKV